MKRLFFILVCLLGCCWQSWGQGWQKLRTGGPDWDAYGRFFTLCTDDSGNVYAAGMVVDSGFISSPRHVAKWNGANWQKLGTGPHSLNANSNILSICHGKDNKLYAAGIFTNGIDMFSGNPYVAQWDGVNWSQVGTDFNSEIIAMCLDDSGYLYAAGLFRDSLGYEYVAKWDGVKWNELGSLHCNDAINSICVDKNYNIYAAGNFSDITGLPYVAKYDQSTRIWSQLGYGFDSIATYAYITSITADDEGSIYAAVNFNHISSGAISGNIFKWNGMSWGVLGVSGSTLNANSEIKSICLGQKGAIYAAGSFTDSLSKFNVFRWDTSNNTWATLGQGGDVLDANCTIYSVCTDNSRRNVYTAGDFTDSATYSKGRCFVGHYNTSLAIAPIDAKSNVAIVYPNPAEDRINFRLPLCGDATVKLSDITGRIMDKKFVCNSSNVVIDVHGYTPGTYFYEILFNGKVESGHVLIQ